MATSKGFDTNTRISRDLAAKFRHAGYAFCGRYLAHAESPLTLAEADDIAYGGMYLVSIYERGFPTKASYFTGGQGQRDAATALAAARACRQPTGTPIYFTVDFDATQEDAAGAITAYFQMVHAALRPAGYLVGVYGSSLVLKQLQADGVAEKFWHAFPHGWGSGVSFAAPDLLQTSNDSTALGVSVDTDESYGNAGGWHPAA